MSTKTTQKKNSAAGKKRYAKPFAGPVHPDWGQRVATRTKLVTDGYVTKSLEVEPGEVIALNVARIWLKDGRRTITFYNVKMTGKRRATVEKVFKPKEATQ